MIKRKKYSQGYKEKLVLGIVSGQSSVTQVYRRESISSTTFNQWRKSLADENFQHTNKSERELRRRVGQLESAVDELALENHILKKISRHSARIAAKREIIRRYLAPYFRIRRSCEAMCISLSTYYYKSEKISEEDQELLKMIEEICEKLPMCGYQKMTKIIRREKIANHKRVYQVPMMLSN